MRGMRQRQRGRTATSAALVRRPHLIVIVVIALTLGLMPSSPALGSLPTNSGLIGAADAGYGFGTLDGYRAEDAGQCDPDTGHLTGGYTGWQSGYGFEQGQHDYHQGVFSANAASGTSVLRYCIEIQPVLNGLIAADPDYPVAWTGKDGVGVLERSCYHRDYGNRCTTWFGGIPVSGKFLLTSLTFEQLDDSGLGFQWRVSGRFQDADDPAITGDFFAGCGGGGVNSLCGWYSQVVYSLVPDL